MKELSRNLYNQYSKSEISNLNSNRKVKNYKYSNLGGLSNTLLKINIKINYFSNFECY